MPKQIIKNRSFLPLWFSQFLSVINDGFIRTVFLFYVSYQMANAGSMFLITSVILYALCFCGASLYAGQIADKISRVRFLRLVRVAEIGLMLMALLFVFLDSNFLLILIWGGLGITMACLRVINNALLPTILDKNHLNFGNIWMKSLSVVGAGFSTLLLMFILKFDAAADIVCLIAVISACISFVATLKIKADKPADEETTFSYNPIPAFGEVLQSLKHQFDRWAYLVGIAWFWILGGIRT